ncbi:MAG: hypothetical protein KDD50_11205 [Bdellovibrionales bacterium]|nr:hypothetical protein [Bdellovibrionales bacterium]
MKKIIIIFLGLLTMPSLALASSQNMNSYSDLEGRYHTLLTQGLKISEASVKDVLPSSELIAAVNDSSEMSAAVFAELLQDLEMAIHNEDREQMVTVLSDMYSYERSVCSSEDCGTLVNRAADVLANYPSDGGGRDGLGADTIPTPFTL